MPLAFLPRHTRALPNFGGRHTFPRSPRSPNGETVTHTKNGTFRKRNEARPLLRKEGVETERNLNLKAKLL